MAIIAAQTLADMIKAKLVEKEGLPQGETSTRGISQPVVLFQHKPAANTDTSPKYSDLFGSVPEGLVDFTVTTHQREDWSPEMEQFFVDVDPMYVHQPSVTYWAVYAIQFDKRCMIAGPPGTGKTALVREIAAQTGRPYIRINGMEGIEPSDLVGSVGLKNGETQFNLGDAALAVKHGALLAYDEPFKNSAAVNMCFQNLAERDNPSLLLYGHDDVTQRHLKPDPRFRMVLCDNVMGTGDGMDKYAATDVQDSSLLNRMSVRIHMDYLSSEAESEMLMQRYPELSGDEASLMVRVASEIRKAWGVGSVSQPYSPRNLMEWAEAYLHSGDVAMAFRVSYGASEDPSSLTDGGTIGRIWNDVGLSAHAGL